MSRYFRRRKFCRFTAEGVTEIDYKDLATLKNYVTETFCGLMDTQNGPFEMMSFVIFS